MNITTAPERFELIASNFVHSEVHKKSASMSFVRARFDGLKDLRLLDVACGAGHFGLSIAGSATQVTFCDPSAAMLDAATRNAMDRRQRCKTVQSTAESLPFEDQSFDLVCSRLAPHHFVDPRLAVREMARVLAPGGHCAIIDLEGNFDEAADELNHVLEVLHDPTHIRSYAQENWCDFVLSAGLRIECIQGGVRESSGGVTVERWCQIAGTDPRSASEIEGVLAGAEARDLATLGIWHDGAGFRLPVRTTIIIASKPRSEKCL